MSKTKNVFISHIHEDDARLSDLKGLCKNKGYDLKDASINSEKPNKANAPDYIKQGILAPQISWAGTMIVLISSETHKSEWVNWEIEYAAKQEMRIVGVWDNGEAEAPLPENFIKYGDALVGWDGSRITEAIEGEIDNWDAPNGKAYPPLEIARIKCQ